MDDNQIIQEMKSTILDLSYKCYLSVDLGISGKDLIFLESLEIDHWQTYNRFGDIDRMSAELPEFFRQIGNDNEENNRQAAEILHKLVSNVILASGKRSAWVCIRASLPSQEFDVPRWHMDGSYYSTCDSFQYKFVVTLKGPQTLFFPITEEMRNLYQDNFQNKEFLSRIFDPREAERAEKGQGIFFIVGNQKLAALHSEPPLDAPRLFISVLPGDHSEIEELGHRWNFL